jgi:hypothetical protein
MLGKPVSKRDDIIVDFRTVPAFEAWWDKEASAWTRVLLWCLTRVRHQTASVGMGAIVALPWLVGARANDIGILSVAMASIVAITVSVAWIDGKYYGHNRGKGTAESSYASQDKAVD